jgi:hypothetical protein
MQKILFFHYKTQGNKVALVTEARQGFLSSKIYA